MNKQKMPMRDCRCGRRNAILNHEINRKYNAQIDGVSVCDQCYVDHLYAKIREKKNA